MQACVCPFSNLKWRPFSGFTNRCPLEKSPYIAGILGSLLTEIEENLKIFTDRTVRKPDLAVWVISQRSP